MQNLTRRFGIALVVAATIVTGLWFWQRTQAEHQTATASQPVIVNQQKSDGLVAATIHLKSDKFEPNEVRIKRGQAITFVNDTQQEHWPASNGHPAHELYPEFDPKRGLKPGESWSFTFERIGSWRMHDHLTPYIKGKVTVTE